MTPDTRDLTDVTFVAFDTETTGLRPLVHKLLEVGAVRFRGNGEELETFQQLIDPQEVIPEDVHRIHGISQAMVRGQPTADRVLPQIVECFGAPDTILLAHNAPFDLGFLAMAMIRVGMDHPPHRIFDTLALARLLGPSLPSYSLEHIAVRLKLAKAAPHRALGDARLVKDVFLALLQRLPRLKTVANLARLSPPLTFADTPVAPIAPPPGFDALATALAEHCALMIIYEGSRSHATPRAITPRVLWASRGVAYVTAYCHLDRVEKTFRLDRMRACWVEKTTLNLELPNLAPPFLTPPAAAGSPDGPHAQASHSPAGADVRSGAATPPSAR
jgi:DNA polymerase-3 subunit epsilon